MSASTPTRIGVHVFAARDAGETLPEILRVVGGAGFDGVEFLEGIPTSLAGEDVEPIREALVANDLEAISVRGGLSRFQNDADAILETYEPLGIDHVVISSFDRELTAIDSVRNLAEELESVGSSVRDRGLGFGIHNHGGLFTPLDGSSAFELLVDETSRDTHLELDVGWLAHDDRDPAILVDQYADRIELLHISDYDPADRGLEVELGDGVVDLEAVAQAAAAAGVDWLCYDCDDPPSVPASLVRAADVLRSLTEP